MLYMSSVCNIFCSDLAYIDADQSTYIMLTSNVPFTVVIKLDSSDRREVLGMLLSEVNKLFVIQ